MKKGKIIVGVILFVVGIVLICTKHGFLASMIVGIGIFMLIPKEYLSNKKKQQKQDGISLQKKWWWLNNH